jgi:hypothetical protein
MDQTFPFNEKKKLYFHKLFYYTNPTELRRIKIEGKINEAFQNYNKTNIAIVENNFFLFIQKSPIKIDLKMSK